MAYESDRPPSKEKEKSFASIRKDLLLPLCSRDEGGVCCEVLKEGILGEAKGAGMRLDKLLRLVP